VNQACDLLANLTLPRLTALGRCRKRAPSHTKDTKKALAIRLALRLKDLTEPKGKRGDPKRRGSEKAMRRGEGVGGYWGYLGFEVIRLV
jgi:hypothetical protein